MSQSFQWPAGGDPDHHPAAPLFLSLRPIPEIREVEAEEGQLLNGDLAFFHLFETEHHLIFSSHEEFGVNGRQVGMLASSF
jgi:hypothetical protein